MTGHSIKTTWCCAAVVVLVAILPLLGQQTTENKGKYYRQLEAISPEAVQYFKEATKAMDKKDNGTAVKKFRQVLKLAPDFVPAIRFLSLVVQNKEQALTLARKAYELDDSNLNKLAVALASIRLKSEDHIQDGVILLEELMVDEPEDDKVHFYYFMAALNLKSPSMLKKKADELEKWDPARAHFYTGTVSILKGNWGNARKELLEAKELGFSTKIVDRLLNKSSIRDYSQATGFFKRLGLLAIILALLPFLLLGLGIVLPYMSRVARSYRALREEQGPGIAARLMEGTYTLLLRVVPFYYYITFLYMIAAVFLYGLRGAVRFSRGPYGLVLALSIALLAIFLERSLFKGVAAKPLVKPQGLVLRLKNAPALFQMLDNLDEAAYTTPVKSVSAVRGKTTRIIEQGTVFKRLIGKGDTHLVLGLGAFDQLTVSQLRHLIAIEIARYREENPAAGRVALRVRGLLEDLAGVIGKNRKTRWFNPAWFFAKGIHILYLRMSEGAAAQQTRVAEEFVEQLAMSRDGDDLSAWKIFADPGAFDYYRTGKK